MAVNVTDKALALASRVVHASDALMKAVRELVAVEAERANSGVSFTASDVEAILASSSLKHVDGVMLNLALSSAASLNTWLAANFHDDNFDKVRP